MFGVIAVAALLILCWFAPNDVFIGQPISV